MIDPVCKTIMQKWGITTFVETGTDQAETLAEVSRWFAEWNSDFGKIVGDMETGAKAYNAWNAPIQYPEFADSTDSPYTLITVDTDEYSSDTARKIFHSNPNIHVHRDSSDRFLASFVTEQLEQDSEGSERCMFFLDAHWGKYWPLRDELKQIVRLDQFVVIIDDFFVPGKSNPSEPRGNYGFDYYGRDVLCWAYIREVLEGASVRVFYGNESNRDQRGWVIITAGYEDDELNTMARLDFLEMASDDPAHTTPVQIPASAKWSVKSLAKSLVPLTWLRVLVRMRQGVTPVK